MSVQLANIDNKNSCGVRIPDSDVTKINYKNEEISEIEDIKLYKKNEISSEFVEIVYEPDPKIKSLDLREFFNAFVRARGDGKDIVVEDYLLGFQLINKLFSLLGNVLSFASVPISSFINNILHRLNGEKREHYTTLRKMLEYEKSKHVDMKSLKSSSSNFYRLHHLLYFARRFFDLYQSLEEKEGLGKITRKAYDETIAELHAGMLVKSLHTAFYFMPTKRTVNEKAEKENYKFRQQVDDLFPKTVLFAKVLLDDTQRIFDEYQAGPLF